MKIAFFCANEYGTIIGKELKERGHDVIFNKLNDDTEITFVLGAPTAFNFNAYLQHRYDVERFIYNGKIVPVVYDVPVWRFNDETWHRYYNIYKTMLETWGNCVTISQFTTDQLKKVWNIDSEPLFTVFDNNKIEKYKKAVDRKKQIIMVGRFVPHKRFDIVMRAIENTDWKLVMCGRDSTHTNYYKNLADNLNINYELHTDPDDEFIIKQYCESQVCIHASVFEGLSLVPKEALWCNTPVIITDMPVHREFHSNFVNYFKPDDIVGLKKVLENKLKLAQNAHIKNLTIDKVTNKVEKWLKLLDTK